MAKKEYYLYVKGKAVPVSEEAYKAYWKITEHEKYLQRKDWKHNVIPFSALDHDGHFVDNLSLIHISEPTRRLRGSRMPSSA